MTTWLILFLFIIIAVITIVVLWVIWPDITGETQAPPPIALQAGFLDACNNVLQCGSGLTCEEGVCKRNIGGNCRILFDCVDDATACENGRCEIVDTGALNQPPNSDGSCENGLAVNSSGICKGEEGFSCSANGSCLSGECQGNACTAQKDAGLACSSNDNCSENLVCSKGFCQSINITTGTEGAYCQPAPCNTGLSCINGFCTLTCQTLGQVCNFSDLLCNDPYACTQEGICNIPPGNLCNANKKCQQGFKCRNGQCLGTTNQPGFVSEHCLSKCLGNYKLLQLVDDKWVTTKYPSLQSKPLSVTEVDQVSYILKNNKEIFMAVENDNKYMLTYLADNSTNQSITKIFGDTRLYASSSINDNQYLLILSLNAENLLQAKQVKLGDITVVQDIIAINDKEFYVLGKQDEGNPNFNVYKITLDFFDNLQTLTVPRSNLQSAISLHYQNGELHYLTTNKILKITDDSLVLEQISKYLPNINDIDHYKIILNNNNLTYRNTDSLDLNLPGYFNDLQGYYKDGNLTVLSQVCK